MNFRFWLLGVKFELWEEGRRACSLAWTRGFYTKRVSCGDEQDARGVCVRRETDKGAEDGTEELRQEL